MHGHVDEATFLEGLAGFLGAYYMTLAIANAVAAFYLWTSRKSANICTAQDDFDSRLAEGQL